VKCFLGLLVPLTLQADFYTYLCKSFGTAGMEMLERSEPVLTHGNR
jgi:hypothetical protein